MSEEEEEEEGHEKGNNVVVLHLFLLVLLGVFIRQIGLKLGLKYPAVLLYFAGLLIGVYFVRHPEQHVFLIQTFGIPIVRTAYTPVYFFLGTFNLESEFLHKRALPHAAACITIWATTTFCVAFLCVWFTDDSSFLNWADYVLVAIIAFNSDMKITKHFMEASHSFSSKEIFILLELESLIASILASLAHDVVHREEIEQPQHVLEFAMRTAFLSIFAFSLGKFTAAFLDRMHHDNVNQMTTMLATVYFTYTSAYVLNASGDLVVVVLGLALMGARPGFSAETLTNVNRFIETYRYSIVGCVQVIGGILFTIVSYQTFTLTYWASSICIYLIVFGIRFIVTIGFWLMFPKVYQLTFVGILTTCTFNIKSVFGLILSFSFLNDINRFDKGREELFILTNFQIFFSTVITKPISSLVFSILDDQTVVEKFTMVQKALDRINENKDSTIRACRCNQFIADADWSTVQNTTNIEKGFFRKFTHSFQLKEHDSLSQMEDESRVKPDAIDDLLRLQKRLLLEQFKHGAINACSAKRVGHLLRYCRHKESLMPTEKIIKETGPDWAMQISLRDLTKVIHKRRSTDVRWVALVVAVFLLDMFLNVYSTVTKMFMYTDMNQYIPIVAASYGLFMGILGVGAVLKTGKDYLHTVNWTLRNWLAWIFTICSFVAFAMNYYSMSIMATSGPNRYTMELAGEGNRRLFFVLNVLSAAFVLLRSSIIACGLYPVQCLLYRTASYMINNCIYNQCDECYGFLQVVMDTHKRLKTRGLDPTIEEAVSNILHQECLAMRQFLGVMEVLTPEVMAALRTRIACSLVLSSQERIINDLNEDGILEYKELELLTDILRKKRRDIASLKTTMAEPSTNEVIKDIPWVVKSELSFRDVVYNASLKSMNPGQPLVEQGEKLKGLIVILRGLVRKESFEPDEASGCRHSSKAFKEKYRIQDQRFSAKDTVDTNEVEPPSHVILEDFYSRGNVIGEFQFLINKTEHKTFRCATNVDILFIQKEAINRLKSRSPKMRGPMKLLEYSLWTTTAIRQAARLLLWSSTYQLLTRCQVYMILEEAYVLDCDDITMGQMQRLNRSTVVLIHGEVTCPITGMHYHGPVVLPSAIIDIYWRRHSGLNRTLRGKRNIILVIPRHSAMLASDSRRTLDNNDTTRIGSDTNVSLMTISSGSSDGIPYRHYQFGSVDTPSSAGSASTKSSNYVPRNAFNTSLKFKLKSTKL